MTLSVVIYPTLSPVWQPMHKATAESKRNNKKFYLDIDYKKDDIRDANAIEKINPTDLL